MLFWGKEGIRIKKENEYTYKGKPVLWLPRVRRGWN